MKGNLSAMLHGLDTQRFLLEQAITEAGKWPLTPNVLAILDCLTRARVDLSDALVQIKLGLVQINLREVQLKLDKEEAQSPSPALAFQGEPLPKKPITWPPRP